MASGSGRPGESVSESSEPGGLFSSAAAPGARRSPPARGVPVEGVVRRVEEAKVVGRGPVPSDQRKFKYDRNRARAMPALPFEATRADRMDAVEAGLMLDRVHALYSLDRESEDVLMAFDKALFFEHTVNGASMLQPGRGKLAVGSSVFDLAPVKAMLGVEQRRFFRAYADEIADVNREVLASYDPYDPVAVEKHAQLLQVAFVRGLQKYPHLAHDSSDAGNRLTLEERVALQTSKRAVLSSTVNKVDAIAARVPDSISVD